ncbi:trichohyalin-like isoform X41 [Rhizophagus clarus]|uniref:Trichohyalin-like isoform X41 n=1 Tax=Rhizophagus clarus TaxID=94130 RepID=A0A8H3LPB8_9GLOM|nr:trichohyalin-like isoform X41 [Rhizophagus clarus]
MDITTPISSLKRNELQKLCKKYGLKANGKNTDLQKKLKQYVLNSGENVDTEDIRIMDVDYNPDINKSSQRNQYTNSISEPTTPQTPSVIPLEQQNKARSSLVDYSQIEANRNIEISSDSRAGDLASINTERQCLSLILYKEPLFFNLTKKEDAESTKEEMEDVNDYNTVILAESTKEEMEDVNDYNTVILAESTKEEMEDINDYNTVILAESTKEEMEDINDYNTVILAESTKEEMEDINDYNTVILVESTKEEMEDVNDYNTVILVESTKEEMEDVNDYNTVILAESTKEEMEDINDYNTVILVESTKEEVEVVNDYNTVILAESTKEEMEDVNDYNTVILAESTKEEMKDINDYNDYTTEVKDEHLVQDENTDLNPNPLNPASEQVEIKVNLEPPNKEAITASVYKELEIRVSQLKALPSPERKRILGINNARSETPAGADNQAFPSPANRFTQAHEKAFSKMPSIATHYAVKKGVETRKRKVTVDKTSQQIKKQKLTQEDRVCKPVVKNTYDRNKITKKNYTSTRIVPNPEERRKKEREEFEKRKKAARSVAQPVLEKNQRKIKEKGKCNNRYWDDETVSNFDNDQQRR